MRQKAYVYAVTGPSEFIDEFHRSYDHLHSYTQLPIYVVTNISRNEKTINKGQIIDVTVDEKLSNKEAAIYLKTNLPKLLPWPKGQIYCYLDSDVFAIKKSADSVFHHFSSPVSFALDHCTIDRFSPWAMKCGCRDESLLQRYSRKLLGQRTQCQHLRQALSRLFQIEIPQEWHHWNGGLFLFSEDSKDFFHSWWHCVQLCFADESFESRDQAALIAAVWLCRLQNKAPLPEIFNKIIFSDDKYFPDDSVFLHLLGKSSSPQSPIMQRLTESLP